MPETHERLCREGLVEARADPDNRRRRLVTLTEEGARVVNQTMAEAVQAEKLLASRLSAEEWDQLNQLLMRMLGAVPATVNGSQAPSH
jgi:DNA-binding MarR family transcriptional regulator